MIQLTINNQPIQVEEGRTLLEACRENGFHIPTLCYHPALEPYGACRLCMVEISRPPRSPRLVASCTYPCEDGLDVLTDSHAVKRSRRMTAELLLASAWNSMEIKTLAQELGVTEVRYQLPQEDRCVLCGLCVRACQEIVGVNAISFVRRGIQKQVSPPFRVSSTVCIGCGTCTLICPTHAIRLQDVTGMGTARLMHHLVSEAHSHYCQVCSTIDLSEQIFQYDDALTASSIPRIARPGD
jgi:NADH dehydrogenase/NADH:ubiquinone oxidoreductase subunit G